MKPQRFTTKDTDKKNFSFLRSSVDSGERSHFFETFPYLNIFSVISVVNFENADWPARRG
jgi:hypothetical protein